MYFILQFMLPKVLFIFLTIVVLILNQNTFQMPYLNANTVCVYILTAVSLCK